LHIGWGVIDDEYIKKGSDFGAVAGRKITLPSAEIAPLIEIVEKLGKRLYEGVTSKVNLVVSGDSGVQK
jgi:hypothetical protein